MKKAKPERVPLSLIVAAPENQPRSKHDRGRIRRIADELRNGGEIRVPLIVVQDTNGGLLLFDGWHRYTAAIEAGAHRVPVEVAETPAEARRRAAEANQHGTEWSRHDAMRHAALRVKSGDFYNASPAGSTVPLSLIAAEYAVFGVKRVTLTRHLDREALTCPEIALFMEACRASNDKRNRPDQAPMLSPEELSDRSRKRRRDAADRHLRRIAELMQGATDGELRETLQTLTRYVHGADDF